MKHNIKITSILIGMFILTQLIGLFIISVYNDGLTLPYGMEPPEEINTETSIFSILFAFMIAIILFFVLTKIKAEKFLRIWFFAVTTLAIALTLNVILFKLNLFNIAIMPYIALGLALPLAFFKIIKRDILIHNLTELMIYPGIASVFIPILGVFGIIILLLIISLYDIWAVWKTSFMKKLAEYQMDKLKIFTGFFIPYANKKQKTEIKKLKEKYTNKKSLTKALEKSKIKINLAILGGGDIVFPIITAGIFYITYGLLSSLIIILFSSLALLFLFSYAKKSKYYPAMPFLTIGIYLGMIVSWILQYFRII